MADVVLDLLENDEKLKTIRERRQTVPGSSPLKVMWSSF